MFIGQQREVIHILEGKNYLGLPTYLKTVWYVIRYTFILVTQKPVAQYDNIFTTNIGTS